MKENININITLNRFICRPSTSGDHMKKLVSFKIVTFFISILFYLASNNPAWAQAKGHASLGLGHGEEGFLHLEEMIKHLEFSINTTNADSKLKAHNTEALQHAKEAQKHYYEALRHASESLGHSARNLEGSGGSGSSSQHEYREEGSH